MPNADTILTYIVAALSIIISVFSYDIRERFLSKWKMRNLSKASKEILFLEQERHLIERLSTNTIVCNAFFWRKFIFVFLYGVMLLAITIVYSRLEFNQNSHGRPYVPIFMIAVVVFNLFIFYRSVMNFLRFSQHMSDPGRRLNAVAKRLDELSAEMESSIQK